MRANDDLAFDAQATGPATASTAVRTAGTGTAVAMSAGQQADRTIPFNRPTRRGPWLPRLLRGTGATA